MGAAIATAGAIPHLVALASGTDQQKAESLSLLFKTIFQQKNFNYPKRNFKRNQLQSSSIYLYYLKLFFNKKISTILRETSKETSYNLVRLVFRPLLPPLIGQSTPELFNGDDCF